MYLAQNRIISVIFDRVWDYNYLCIIVLALVGYEFSREEMTNRKSLFI